jgi:hypothetical protein
MIKQSSVLVLKQVLFRLSILENIKKMFLFIRSVKLFHSEFGVRGSVVV